MSIFAMSVSVATYDGQQNQYWCSYYCLIEGNQVSKMTLIAQKVNKPFAHKLTN